MRKLLGLCLLPFLSLPGPSAASEIFPLDQVRPGMVGVGRTVFEGDKIEDFKVIVLGVLDNVTGPRGSIILARLEGGPLEKTGVIAGMSGSPVTIDGKLLGAVAFGFPFSKETIAGITPIASMIEATRLETPRAAAATFRLPFSAQMSPESLVASFRKALMAGAPSTGGGLSPLPLPLVFSGFEPTAFEAAREFFPGSWMAPVLGGASATLAQPEPTALVPGSAIGVSLVEGDLDLSVTGTVTAVEAGRVYAFGHPFYNLGPTQFPMKKAFVYSVFPSLYQSFKISATGEDVGTLDQDRMTAVSGRLGSTPRMIPVRVRIRTSRAQEREYGFRIVEDELFSPILAYVSLLSVLQANERAYGTSTIGVDAHLKLAGRSDVTIEDLFTQEQPSVQASALVAAPLAFLLGNDFERVTVEKVDVSITSYETTQRARLERCWLDKKGPLKAGMTVPLRLLMRTFRGESFAETIPLSIPPNARAGTYSLLVADAPTLTNLEAREMRQPFVPRDLDQLIRAINSLRRASHIYARLLRSDEGAIVSGEYLQSLPPSVLSVLGGGDQGSPVIPIRTTSVWDFDLPTRYAFSGSRTLTVALER